MREKEDAYPFRVKHKCYTATQHEGKLIITDSKRHLLYESDDNEPRTEEEMKAFVAASMARHKVPRYVEFVDSFPMNAAGKILKYKMREQAIEKLKLQKAASIETA